MGLDTRREGRRFFTLNNWTALCAATLTTIALTGTIVTVGWAVWGRDQVDARVEKMLFPVDARVGILETYIPQIEDALNRNAANFQAIMTPIQRARGEQIYQDMRRSRIRMTK